MKAIDICIYFEHWADAYQAAELVLEMSNKKIAGNNKRKIDPQDKVELYTMFAKIFWNSKYYLMHAASISTVFTTYKKKKDRTDEEKINQSNLTAVSILATPLFSQRTFDQR